MKKAFLIIILVLTLIAPALYGEGAFLEPPAIVFDGMTFFNKEMYSLLKILEYQQENKEDYFLNLYWSFCNEINFSETEGVPGRSNSFFDINIQCADFIWLSFFHSGSSGRTKFPSLKTTSEEFYELLGGGLSFKNDLFFIGVYGGLANGSNKTETEIYNPDTGDFNKWEYHRSNVHENDFVYSIIPIYYPKYLSFIKEIALLLHINVYKPNAFSLNVPLREFRVFNRAVNLAFYYHNERYDPAAKNNLYGMKVSAELWSHDYEDIGLNIMLDAGYQQFVDINDAFNFSKSYHDTPYLNLGLEFQFEEWFIISLSAEISKNNPYPNFVERAVFSCNFAITTSLPSGPFASQKPWILGCKFFGELFRKGGNAGGLGKLFS